MMWLLLFALTALVAVLPMVPALLEWHRPSDVVPLHIDTEDALDPPFMARSFVQRLRAAVADRAAMLGSSPLVSVAGGAAWPLSTAERHDATSRRVWHVAGDSSLPDGIDFLGEVAAEQSLCTPGGHVTRAVYAGRHLNLGPRSTVLRWAHAQTVEAGAGSALHGRVSADELLTLQPDVAFTLLHAPTIRFAADAPTAAPAPAAPPTTMFHLGLPEQVAWDAGVGRGVADGALDIEASRAWRGDLVCRGNLSIGVGCNAHGSIKAVGDIEIGAGSSVTGSVVATGRIVLQPGVVVRGAVVAERGIDLGNGCQIGLPGKPATVTAPAVVAAAGVVVHGTVWAVEGGHSAATAARAGRLTDVDALPATSRGAAA